MAGNCSVLFGRGPEINPHKGPLGSLPWTPQFQRGDSNVLARVPGPLLSHGRAGQTDRPTTEQGDHDLVTMPRAVSAEQADTALECWTVDDVSGSESSNPVPSTL